MMQKVLRRNGEEFDYSTLYNRPFAEDGAAPAALLLPGHVVRDALDPHLRPPQLLDAAYMRRCLWCLVAAVGLYCVAPVTEWHTGRIVLNCMGGRMFDYMLLLKCSFAVASMLYGRIYVLISQRQAVVVENERLKNENLTTRYNLLVGQINPPLLLQFAQFAGDARARKAGREGADLYRPASPTRSATSSRTAEHAR